MVKASRLVALVGIHAGTFVAAAADLFEFGATISASLPDAWCRELPLKIRCVMSRLILIIM